MSPAPQPAHPDLSGRRVLLAVGGGIAAYKAPELVRRLKDAGAEVQVMLTSAGAKFVSALALEVVSGHPVGLGLWQTDAESRIVHTDRGKAADVIVIAPATANLIARIRQGMADDLVTTTVMACTTPVMLCPSMNTEMLNNPLVQENITALESLDRYTLLTPSTGELACGVVGAGRLPDPPEIIDGLDRLLSHGELRGVRVTVTAGPTREALDPVRFLTNHSTGTMGFALASAFAQRGAKVTLIAGPVAHATPRGVAQRIDITTASDIEAAVDAAWEHTDVLVMTAAVADYRPASPAAQKLKKGSADLTLPLVRTTDILASTATLPGRAQKVIVGFAAETEDLEVHARHKLTAKSLDAIVANDVSAEGAGFGQGDNTGLLMTQDGVTPLPRAPKAAFAESILEALIPAIRSRLDV
ncbi:MAG: bifunctional phosphopantothenoylcysteine decarboxylase/phosphopantothenate--cysteine ligase CoaBC [Myxococcota bacterium]